MATIPSIAGDPEFLKYDLKGGNRKIISAKSWIHTCNFSLQSHRVDLPGSLQHSMFWDFHLCCFQSLKQVWLAGVPSPCSSWPPWYNWVLHRWNLSTHRRVVWTVCRGTFPKIPKHLLPVCRKTLPHIQLQPLLCGDQNAHTLISEMVISCKTGAQLRPNFNNTLQKCSLWPHLWGSLGYHLGNR